MAALALSIAALALPRGAPAPAIAAAVALAAASDVHSRGCSLLTAVALQLALAFCCRAAYCAAILLHEVRARAAFSRPQGARFALEGRSFGD